MNAQPRKEPSGIAKWPEDERPCERIPIVAPARFMAMLEHGGAV